MPPAPVLHQQPPASVWQQHLTAAWLSYAGMGAKPTHEGPSRRQAGSSGSGAGGGRPRFDSPHPYLPRASQRPAAILIFCEAQPGAPMPCSLRPATLKAGPAQAEQAAALIEPVRSAVSLIALPCSNQPAARPNAPPAVLHSARHPHAAQKNISPAPPQQPDTTPLNSQKPCYAAQSPRPRVLAGERRRGITCTAPPTGATLQLRPQSLHSCSPCALKVGSIRGGRGPAGRQYREG